MKITIFHFKNSMFKYKCNIPPDENPVNRESPSTQEKIKNETGL